MDFHGILIVHRRWVHLRFARWNRGIAFNHPSHNSSERLDTKREWSNIKKEDVFYVSLNDSRLDCCSESHGFIRVYGCVRLFGEECFHFGKHQWYPSRTSDENDFVNLTDIHSCIFEYLSARLDGSFHEVSDEFFEFLTSENHMEIAWNSIIHRNKWLINFSWCRAWELDFRLFCGTSHSLYRARILAEINSFFRLKLRHHPFENTLIEVVSSEVCVSVRREYFECSLRSDFEDGDIESSSSEIIDRNFFIFLSVDTVGKGCRGWLIDNSLYIESGNLPGVDSRLSFAIVEIRRNGDNRFRNLGSEELFRITLEFLKHFRRDFLRSNSFSVPFDETSSIWTLGYFEGNILEFFRNFRELSSDKTLRRVDSLGRIYDCLTFCGHSDNSLPFFVRYNRGSRPSSFRVRDNLRLTSFHKCDARVRGSEVDSDNLWHMNDR
ncbi:MAG: hypothetical protein ACD_78C00334G0001 [uncultured bacterium (gcode 4)]|uniref:Uncharacterized protein n=1 Tax=uncultured bacterium (gcode 4) TaxID=1234023 RepID=K1YBA6_9BACT|nr:MAG: hypothetical protein ACD_78C00334G0001 [uncultured bacterium (gcode 4)]